MEKANIICPSEYEVTGCQTNSSEDAGAGSSDAIRVPGWS
jgi:hypothetical protein